MKLNDICLLNNEALDYMERKINEGSLSGFTRKNTSTDETNPFLCESFKVKKFYPKENNIITSYGLIPDFCYPRNSENDYVYIHPDWLSKKSVEKLPKGTIEDGEIVIPTSSVRTVRIKGTNYYLKLAYPGEIGRLKRDLHYEHLMSGIELTDTLMHMKENVNVPRLFEFMPEIGGKILKSDSSEFGFLIRKIPDSISSCYIIPAFSLIARDNMNPNDECLLIQLLNIKERPRDFFLDYICFPLIDIFFFCYVTEGLIPEMHSQNILYALDEEFKVKKVVLRDLESFDKDVSMREKLSLKPFLSFPYKCFSKSDKYYLMRHSFMFDHKLCEYLINPLVKCASYILDSKNIISTIKEYVHDKLLSLDEPFFLEDNCWYKYPNEEIDRTTSERPYVAIPNPIYR